MENQFTPKNEDFQIFNILNKYLNHWPWFALSMILCCGLAFLYIKATPKLYKRTATVLINEDNNPDISAAFSERNQDKAKINVNNEIEAFRSPQLTQEVVKRLKLNINYATKEGLRKRDLYTLSPITAAFPNSYEPGSFSFQVELLPDSVVVLSDFVQQENRVFQRIKTKLNEVTSTPMGNIVISPSLYYSSDHYPAPIEVSKNDMNAVAIGFSKALNISLSNKLNTVIVLEIEDVSVQRAEDFLNTLISGYKENWLSEKNQATITTLNFITERIPLIEQELKSIDDKMEQYKSKHLLTDTRDAASVYRRESSEYSAKVLEVSNQVTIAEYIQSYLNKNDHTLNLLPTNTGLDHSSIEASIKQYNDQLLERNRLIANSGENNPVIMNLTNSLSFLRQSIIQSVDNLIVTLNMQLSSLQSQESRTAVNIASNPGQEKQLTSIEREQKIKESLYVYLLQKREENELSLFVTQSNSQVISAPSGSVYPVKPQKIKILLIALLAGVALPGSIIWGRDAINTTIRDRNDLSALSVPLLGIVPEAREKGKKGMLLVQENGRGAIDESFRIIRTNLEFNRMPDMKVVQFTSLEPGAGKTFMAVNLAMSFALAGKKVVLLDLDLRTATLSGIIEYPEIGISNMLSKMVMDERFFIEKDYFYPGFDIIPAGPMPANPSELLMSDHLKILIEKLKTVYDYVFIDCTPFDLVVDAAIVAKLADFSIFVVREKYADRRTLPELENIYRSDKLKNVRIILNASKAEMPSEKYNAYYSKKTKHARLLSRTTAIFDSSRFLTEGSKHES
jgi:capsular exopolysaccharide synthesis family protein